MKLKPETTGFVRGGALYLEPPAKWRSWQRYRELRRRKAAEANYEELRDALRLAIGNGAKAAALRFTIDQPHAG